MRTHMMRARWLLVGLALMMALAVTLWAQEPQIFERGITLVRGNLSLAGSTSSTVSFEGATADANETRILVADPTADRDWTIPNEASNTFVGRTRLSEVVTAANILTAAESSSTFYLNAVAGFLTTLPAPALGLHYRFVVQTAPTSNGYTIGTPTANIIYGMVEERAGTAGVACAAEDLLTLVANQAIVGDWLDITSDGTNWYVSGMTDVAAGFTCTVT